MKLLLPILADIANGIFATLIVWSLFEVSLSWHFLVGIVFALLPDVDALPRLIQTGSVVATKENPVDHREYGHYPILYFFGGVLIAIFDQFFGVLFIVATMLHFFNDTWGTGFGVMWLWPFTKRKFKLRFFDTVTVQKERGHSLESAKPDKNQWINRVYLTVNAISVTEYALFVLSLILLVSYSRTV